jgi:hypothetical protein
MGRSSIRHSFWVFALGALAASGCGGNDCPTLRECDIREAECQERTAEVAACLRGGDEARPAVTVVDKDAFIEEQVQSVRQSGETADERDLRRGLALLALMPWSDDPVELSRDRWRNVAAFYSSDSHGVTILDDGDELDGPGAVLLLLHEMIHAMQGPEMDAWYEQHGGTFDRELSLSSLIEGEAVLYDDLAALYGYGLSLDDIDWKESFRTFKSASWNDARTTDAGYARAYSHFSYAFGGAYLNAAYRDAGNVAVRRVFEAPPLSTRAVMAGYNAVDPPLRADPNEVGRPVLPEQYSHLATLHLGAWLSELFRDVWSASHRGFGDYVDSGFTGDVLSIFRGPFEGEVTSVWRLRFERADQADAYVSRFLAREYLTVRVEERDVIVVASVNESVVRVLPTQITWAPAPERDMLPQDAAPAALQRSRRFLCAHTR